jgi:hypothetical protein
MKDPWNPTAEEIVQWAYEPDSLAPVQDWNLAVTHDSSCVPLLVQLAADDTCPKRRFFLDCIYLFIGDAVRSSGLSHDLEQVRKLLDGAAQHHSPCITLWVARSRKLIEHPEEFDYPAWCDGGLSREDAM